MWCHDSSSVMTTIQWCHGGITLLFRESINPATRQLVTFQHICNAVFGSDLEYLNFHKYFHMLTTRCCYNRILWWIVRYVQPTYFTWKHYLSAVISTVPNQVRWGSAERWFGIRDGQIMYYPVTYACQILQHLDPPKSSKFKIFGDASFYTILWHKSIQLTNSKQPQNSYYQTFVYYKSMAQTVHLSGSLESSLSA